MTAVVVGATVSALTLPFAVELTMTVLCELGVDGCLIITSDCCAVDDACGSTFASSVVVVRVRSLLESLSLSAAVLAAKCGLVSAGGVCDLVASLPFDSVHDVMGCKGGKIVRDGPGSFCGDAGVDACCDAVA